MGLANLCSQKIRNISALQVFRNRALQIDIYLLTYKNALYIFTLFFCFVI